MTCQPPLLTMAFFFCCCSCCNDTGVQDPAFSHQSGVKEGNRSTEQLGGYGSLSLTNQVLRKGTGAPELLGAWFGHFPFSLRSLVTNGTSAVPTLPPNPWTNSDDDSDDDSDTYSLSDEYAFIAGCRRASSSLGFFENSKEKAPEKLFSDCFGSEKYGFDGTGYVNTPDDITAVNSRATDAIKAFNESALKPQLTFKSSCGEAWVGDISDSPLDHGLSGILRRFYTATLCDFHGSGASQQDRLTSWPSAVVDNVAFAHRDIPLNTRQRDSRIYRSAAHSVLSYEDLILMYENLRPALENLNRYTKTNEGLIRHLESLGYKPDVPYFAEGLTVELMEFQKQTVKWCLDRGWSRGLLVGKDPLSELQGPFHLLQSCARSVFRFEATIGAWWDDCRTDGTWQDRDFSCACSWQPSPCPSRIW